MIHLRDNIYAVEVPEDASPYILDSANGKEQGLFWTQPGVTSPPWIVLPPGTWEIVCTSKAVTENQAKDVVAEKYNYFPETVLDEIFAEVSIDTYRGTLDSLLTSKGCDVNKNYLILKKV